MLKSLNQDILKSSNEIEKKSKLKEERRNILEKNTKKLNDVIKEEKEIINKLLIHYHKILFEGSDTRAEGLSWVIKAIWSLGCEVILSYLPNFLDEKAIKYLFEVSL